MSGTTAGMLTPHFSRAEVIRSHTAEQDARLAALQREAPDSVWEAALGVALRTLEPARQEWGSPFFVHSWYRSPALNKAIHGSPRSQHVAGEAVDLHVDAVSDPVRDLVWRRWPPELKRPARVTPNWFLWAYFAARLDELDVDQVIHEFGEWGAPSWVHVAGSDRQDNRVVSIASRDDDGHRIYRHFSSFAEAARGVAEAA